MNQNVKIYKENYVNLPGRFVEKIEHDIRFLLEADIKGLKKIYLFGSCARGDVRSSSDVDLLVVTDQKISDRALAADIRWSLDEPVNGVKTDIVYKNEASEEMQNVFENIVKHEKKMILEVIG
ncbi:nucleotidyltransferase domain-containing protein [Lachnospiraceae bacterium 48-42]|nr:nucleotidyltransferase domain-containing protein [Dorea sp.]